jgi:hypothetical protein
LREISIRIPRNLDGLDKTAKPRVPVLADEDAVVGFARERNCGVRADLSVIDVDDVAPCDFGRGSSSERRWRRAPDAHALDRVKSALIRSMRVNCREAWVGVAAVRFTRAAGFEEESIRVQADLAHNFRRENITEPTIRKGIVRFWNGLRPVASGG